MFSRFSTWYLFLSSACLLLMCGFPIAIIHINDDYFDFTIRGLIYLKDGKVINPISLPMFILLPAMSIFSMSSVFFAKKLSTQMHMGHLNYLFHALVFALIFYSTHEAILQMENGDQAQIGYRGFYFAVASLAFVFLANRSIKQELKMEELLKKMKGKKK